LADVRGFLGELGARLAAGESLQMVTGPGFDVAALASRIAEAGPATGPVVLRTGEASVLESPEGGRLTVLDANRRDVPADYDLLAPDAHAELGREYFLAEATRLGLDTGRAAACADLFAPATAWLGMQDPADSALEALVTNERFLRDVAASMSRLSPATQDLGRFLTLLSPSRVERSDDWATLAALVYRRPYSPADVSRALLECGGLLTSAREGSATVVEPSSRAAHRLLGGLVPPSASEHAALYRALRERAEVALLQPDESDAYVARQLPRQAVAGGCLPQLIGDPLGMTLSDTYSLAYEIERNPAILGLPGARAFLLAAHSLAVRSAPARTSYYESALLQVGNVAGARQLAERTGGRAWRPVWHRASPVNVERIMAELSSPVLGLTSCSDQEGICVAACSDGTLWRVAPYEHARVVADLSHQAGEIRACAHGSADGEELLVAAGSDRVVTALDASTGAILWRNSSVHQAPLSAAAAGSSGGRIIMATSGVDGLIRTWDGRTGEPGPVRLDRRAANGIPIETRSLAIVSGDPGWLGFCSVDGVVGVLPLSPGGVPSECHTGLGVLNAIDLSFDGSSLSVAVTSSAGDVAMLEWNPEGATWTGPVVIATTAAALNAVDLDVEDGARTVVGGSSDSTLVVAHAEGSSRLAGHTGPVTSVRSTQLHGSRALVTSSVDGTVRLWLREPVLAESLGLQRATRHAGPVTAIRAVRTRGDDLVLTGGSDGDVRLWDVAHGTAGRVLDRSLNGISAIEVIEVDSATGELKVLTATGNGSLTLSGVVGGEVIDRSPMGISLGGISALCLSVDGDRTVVISGSFDGAVSVWNPLRADPQVPLIRSDALHFGSVTALAAIPRRFGEALCAVGSQDGSLSLRRVNDLSEVRQFQLDYGVTSLASIPHEDSSLVAGLENGSIAMLRRGALCTYDAHAFDVTKVVVSVVAGRMALFSSGNDRRVRIWDLETMTLLQEIPMSGLPTDLHVVGNRVAVSSSTGAAIFELSDEVSLMLSRQA
jgi:WD40 repeat protein